MPLLGCLVPGTPVEIIKNFSSGPPWLLIGAQHLSPLEESAHFFGWFTGMYHFV